MHVRTRLHLRNFGVPDNNVEAGLAVADMHLIRSNVTQFFDEAVNCSCDCVIKAFPVITLYGAVDMSAAYLNTFFKMHSIW